MYFLITRFNHSFDGMKVKDTPHTNISSDHDIQLDQLKTAMHNSNAYYGE